MQDFLEMAKRRFPSHVVGGYGRWALYTPSAGPMGKVLLFENRDAAAAQILDPKLVQIVDLLAPNIRDDWEDRQWERRFGKRNG
jgi:hypothetical protein